MVFLIIVGTVGCYYYRRYKAVIMKVGIAQDGCCGGKELDADACMPILPPFTKRALLCCLASELSITYNASMDYYTTFM